MRLGTRPLVKQLGAYLRRNRRTAAFRESRGRFRRKYSRLWTQLSLRWRTIHPPSSSELRLIAELRKSIRALPEPPVDNNLESHAWNTFRRTLSKSILSNDPRAFLSWEVIRQSMFVGEPGYVRLELDRLRDTREWSPRWERAIEEADIGMPTRISAYRRTSGNLVHHAFVLNEFETKAACRVEELKMVVEFGGGYGAMCRLFHNLGFAGRYVIYDLPEFSALQSYYLGSLGLPVIKDSENLSTPEGVFCVSALSALGELCVGQPIDLLVGTWSISEAPVAVREAFFAELPIVRRYLFAFQPNHGGVDNITYFASWARRDPEMTVTDQPIEHWPVASHLFVGIRNGLVD